MTDNFPALRDLRFGDCLLYHPSDALGRMICIKTWSEFSHVSMFVGEGLFEGRTVWASRAAEPPHLDGVDFYAFRHANIGAIRRPIAPFDAAAVKDFCIATCGQRYDLWGLLRFFTIGAGAQDRMFCSEAYTRAMRKGGVVLFDNADADEVSPGMLDVTRDLTDVWRLRPHGSRE